MRKINFVIYLAISFCCLPGCVIDTAPNKNATSKPESYDVETANSDSSGIISTIGNNKHIHFDTLEFQVPDDIDITSKNIYNGIYELKSDSLVRHKIFLRKGVVFLTTFEDLGTGIRANLYAYDLAHKSFIRDSIFKRNYVHSSAGIFVFGTNKILSIDKEQWYDLKNEGITPAALFEVKGLYFRYIKNVYEIGDKIFEDTTSLVPFFKSSILPSSNSVFPLPDDWWKVEGRNLRIKVK
jgi:hypothetical protein